MSATIISSSLRPKGLLYRVEDRLASMKKGIYSLSPLSKLLRSANRRYLEFISDIDDTCVGIKILNKISKSVIEKNRRYKEFNLFSEEDQKLFEAILSGEFNISGFQNKNLREKLNDKTCPQISRILKRLRTHGIIKKIGHTYKYYLTKSGRKVILSGLKMKELFLIANRIDGLISDNISAGSDLCHGGRLVSQRKI